MEDAGDMEQDADADADADADEDADGEGDEEENEEEDEDGAEDDDESPEQSRVSINTANTNGSSVSFSQINGGPTSHPHPTLVRTSASPQQSGFANIPRIRLEVRPEALTASSYDIVPTIAAPQATSINAIAATPDMRYWFTGGSDGYIRKYDGVQSINGKTLLTVAQRHPFVDSVVKAGVLLTYWDNEEPATLKNRGVDLPISPVYSLAVQSQALWMLSGLESGAINLYSVRHNEGHCVTSLMKHKSAVSVLTMARDETTVLSGSWDKSVIDWDLNTGQVKRSFEGSGGQISAIEIRPASTLPVPEESGEEVSKEFKTLTNGALTNGAMTNGHVTEDTTEEAQGSPSNDSLFGDGGDSNSLFGETTGEGAPSGGHFGDEDDEFSRAMMAPDNNDDSQGAIALGSTADSSTVGNQSAQTLGEDTQMNGASYPETATQPSTVPAPETQDAVATYETTFLAASMDGTLRVWDRRQPNPIARIQPKTGVPPWCVSACWSPDGNFIYAGRRNGTVEEYSLHKGLKAPERTLKFPRDSKAITSMKAMPNGRHLLW